MLTANLGLALEMHARLSGRKLEQPQVTQKINSSSKPFLMPDIYSHQGKLKNRGDQLTGHIVL